MVCLITGTAIALAVAAQHHRTPATLVITVNHEVLPADGDAQTQMRARASDGAELRTVSWQFKKGENLVRVENSFSNLELRAGTVPGDVILVATATGFNAGQADIRLNLDPTDRFGDGTPDFLRLQNPSDQGAFRRWFSFLAESIYFEREQDRPPEIHDCAALIRFAYRESLRRHDGAWATSVNLHSLPNVASVFHLPTVRRGRLGFLFAFHFAKSNRIQRNICGSSLNSQLLESTVRECEVPFAAIWIF